MKKNTIIKFTKYRFLFFLLSLLIIAGGIVGIVTNDGLNLGIDFEAGLSQRIQIADQAMSVSYGGSDDVTLNVVNGNLIIEIRNEEGVERTTLPPEEYATLNDLASALREFDDVSVSLTWGNASSFSLKYRALVERPEEVKPCSDTTVFFSTFTPLLNSSLPRCPLPKNGRGGPYDDRPYSLSLTILCLHSFA